MNIPGSHLYQYLNQCCLKLPRGALTSKMGASIYYVAKFSPQNCIKMKLDLLGTSLVPLVSFNEMFDNWNTLGITNGMNIIEKLKSICFFLVFHLFYKPAKLHHPKVRWANFCCKFSRLNEGAVDLQSKLDKKVINLERNVFRIRWA